MDFSTPGLPVHHQLPEFIQTHVHWVFCHPLLLLPSIFLSIRVFSNESVLHIMWPKYWSTFNNSPSKNTQDWFPLGWTTWISLLSKGFSSLLQHHSSKASSLWHSAFFMIQLSHPYMTAGKNYSFDDTDICQQNIQCIGFLTLNVFDLIL